MIEQAKPTYTRLEKALRKQTKTIESRRKKRQLTIEAVILETSTK